MKVQVKLWWADEMPRSSLETAELVDIPRTAWFDDDIEWHGGGGDDLDIAEILWSQFNRHDAPDQHPALDARAQRSMSVGDVIELRDMDGTNPRFYLAVSVGFEPVEGVRA